MSWTTQERDDGVHVFPNGDLVEHRMSVSCACAPSVAHLGSTCLEWNKFYAQQLVVHAAADGRLE